MTPREIVNAAATVRARMSALIEERTRAEEEAIAAERTRIRKACAESTGHIFGAHAGFMGEYRACVYCGAPPGDLPEPGEVPVSDV